MGNETVTDNECDTSNLYIAAGAYGATATGQPQQPFSTQPPASAGMAAGAPLTNSVAPSAHGACVSWWIKDYAARQSLFPKLNGDAGHYDVCIVGGGLTGLMAAYTLSQEANKRVILLEARDVGGSTSGYSTAKVGSSRKCILAKHILLAQIPPVLNLHFMHGGCFPICCHHGMTNFILYLCCLLRSLYMRR